MRFMNTTVIAITLGVMLAGALITAIVLWRGNSDLRREAKSWQTRAEAFEIRINDLEGYLKRYKHIADSTLKAGTIINRETAERLGALGEEFDL